jgi:hypothetical protein
MSGTFAWSLKYILLLSTKIRDKSSFCATVSIFVLLTVTCNYRIHGERIVAFPRQQWLRERATMLRYTYIAYLVIVEYEHKPRIFLLH